MEKVLSSPELRGFLPMLYIAWADGELEEDELREVRRKIDAQAWLSPQGREALLGWLDAATPPTATDLARLLSLIRKSAGTLKVSNRCSLAELGRKMSEAAPGSSPAELERALRDLTDALNIDAESPCEPLLGEKPTRDSLVPKAFDSTGLQALLDGDTVDARNAARRFLSLAEHRVHDLDRDTYRQKVLEWVKELAQRELSFLAYPRVMSDAPSLAPFMSVFETLGHGDLSLVVKFGVQFGLFGGSIFFLGTDEQQKRYLPDVARAKLLGCFAMSELGHGSNVMDLETTATFDPAGDCFVLHTPSEMARKEWIGNAAEHGTMATVFAQLRVGEEWHGVHAFLVPIREESGAALKGITIGDCGPKMGLEGVDNGQLSFDQVRVPRDQLLGRFANVNGDGTYESAIASPTKRFFTMLGTLVGGRICVAKAGLSAAKTGMTIAVRYGSERRQFGPQGAREVPLLEYRTHQRRLMPRLAMIYALHFSLDDLQQKFVARTKETEREVEGLAAALKAYATWQSTDCLRESRECCGGQGYLTINRLPSLICDAEIFKTFEGDNTVLMQLAAKGILTEYKQHFRESRLGAIVDEILGSIGTAVSEKNPWKARSTDTKHLLDPSYHEALLLAREGHLKRTVALRMKKRLDRGSDPFNALLDTQDHLVSLSEAYVERVLQQEFARVLANAGEQAETLTPVYQLFALHRMLDRAGWFLDQGFFESGKLGAVRKELNRLCSEVRMLAPGLVSAFAIPDAALGAPIAFGQGTGRTVS